MTCSCDSLDRRTLAEHGEPAAPAPLAGAALLGILLQRLEIMFDDQGLSQLRRSRPAHPAVRRFDALLQLLREGGRIVPEQVNLAVESLREWIDTDTWYPASPGPTLWDFIVDDNTRTSTIARLSDADGFPDVVAELFYCGWLRGQGLNADRIEEGGRTDIAVERGTATEIRVEVKRIHRGTNPENVRNIVRKANSQIKASDPAGGGILFLSLDVPLQCILPGGEFQPTLRAYLDVAKSATRSDNSSVGAVVASWDEFEVKGDWGEVIEVVLYRRFAVIGHPAARVEPAVALGRLVGQTTARVRIILSGAAGLNQTPQELLAALRAATVGDAFASPVQVTVAEPLRSDSQIAHLAGTALVVSRKKARAGFASPNSVAIHDVGLGSAIVTARPKTNSGSPLLVLHAVRDGTGWTVYGGWRVYDDSTVLDRLACDANEAFATVLERYGSRFNTGLGRAWWTRELRVPLPDGVMIRSHEDLMGWVHAACGFSATQIPEMASAPFMAQVQGREIVVAGLYWIHGDKYRAAIQAAEGSTDR